mmetsp:Transcript_34624/g.112660  ORF Transcript_34624/g.112660 Transcript_34624/m.112660 type:complete len:697 (+) Transcript_34624:178-2268(+)
MAAQVDLLGLFEDDDAPATTALQPPPPSPSPPPQEPSPPPAANGGRGGAGETAAPIVATGTPAQAAVPPAAATVDLSQPPADFTGLATAAPNAPTSASAAALAMAPSAAAKAPGSGSADGQAGSGGGVASGSAVGGGVGAVAAGVAVDRGLSDLDLLSFLANPEDLATMAAALAIVCAEVSSVPAPSSSTGAPLAEAVAAPPAQEVKEDFLLDLLDWQQEVSAVATSVASGLEAAPFAPPPSTSSAVMPSAPPASAVSADVVSAMSSVAIASSEATSTAAAMYAVPSAAAPAAGAAASAAAAAASVPAPAVAPATAAVSAAALALVVAPAATDVQEEFVLAWTARDDASAVAPALTPAPAPAPAHAAARAHVAEGRAGASRGGFDMANVVDECDAAIADEGPSLLSAFGGGGPKVCTVAAPPPTAARAAPGHGGAAEASAAALGCERGARRYLVRCRGRWRIRAAPHMGSRVLGTIAAGGVAVAVPIEGIDASEGCEGEDEVSVPLAFSPWVRVVHFEARHPAGILLRGKAVDGLYCYRRNKQGHGLYEIGVEETADLRTLLGDVPCSDSDDTSATWKLLGAAEEVGVGVHERGEGSEGPASRQGVREEAAGTAAGLREGPPRPPLRLGRRPHASLHWTTVGAAAAGAEQGRRVATSRGEDALAQWRAGPAFSEITCAGEGGRGGSARRPRHWPLR